ncbi:FKBP-type peptidyl-prolyl cis-trans isomerase [Candidatus Woesearchaeota archaeon]|nr:FKBP-type peptidyl-prolyl cis-trans isomerase [Candidatus Woesearchaeota archaeon]
MIKKGMFIEINFTAKLADSDKVFDTTNKEVAEQNHFHEKHDYKPITICVGHKDIIEGLDEQLIGKELKKYTFNISAEKGFGKKHHELIKLVPSSLFAQQNIRPVPGLQINLNDMIGTIRSVSGGRTVIDFNHPLAGKDLTYEVEILREVKDLKEKVSSVISQITKKFELIINNNEVEIKSNIKKDFQEKIAEEIKSRISEIKEVKFSKEENAK